MDLLVTGARGFIGRHLAGRAGRLGHRVVSWTGDLRELRHAPHTPDAVVHLASGTRRDRLGRYGEAEEAADLAGTAEVLAFCQRTSARCVLASSCAVYGPGPHAGALCEDSRLGTPCDPYARGKYLAERRSREAAVAHGLRVVILRLFNVYGAGQRPMFLVPYVVGCLRHRQPVRLRMPDAARDFVHVDDVVEAFLSAAAFDAADVQTFNVGSGVGTRVRDLVEQAERVIGDAVAIETIGPRPGEPAAAVADLTRVRDALGWTPTCTLQAGLLAMSAEV